MADQLATTGDLASALQATIDPTTAVLLLECATAVVQEAAGGQRIVQVQNDPLPVMGTTAQWLDLPQIPVTAVDSVVVDGTTLATSAPGGLPDGYRLHGNRLWRTSGWQTYIGEPSQVLVTCDHGYPPGSQELQLGRSAVLSLAKGVYTNPSGATSVAIDDYRATYEAMSALMESSPNLRNSLRRQYGRRAGLVRIG